MAAPEVTVVGFGVVDTRRLTPVDLPAAADDALDDALEPALLSWSAWATADPDSNAAPTPATIAPVPNKM
ncbi:hypothetical protein MSAR_25250 [Mycolicibacterium sarraceniae]|uniref:Uncharacterized protein n=1 Tax=Mycolicibacterium sarraceniae TaxID=1534348 RepID=A0A7I7STA7_9MYCO|nr:hypothetical protein MSAR_25250 [Mycolicibacterium sarraceniae]